MPEATPMPHPLAAIARAKQLLTLAADEYRAAVLYGRPLDEAQAALHEADDAVVDASQAIHADAVDLIAADPANEMGGPLYAALLNEETE